MIGGTSGRTLRTSGAKRGRSGRIGYIRYGKTGKREGEGWANYYIVERRKAPLTATGLFLFSGPIALFSGLWLLLRANGKL